MGWIVQTAADLQPVIEIFTGLGTFGVTYYLFCITKQQRKEEKTKRLLEQEAVNQSLWNVYVVCRDFRDRIAQTAHDDSAIKLLRERTLGAFNRHLENQPELRRLLLDAYDESTRAIEPRDQELEWTTTELSTGVLPFLERGEKQCAKICHKFGYEWGDEERPLTLWEFMVLWYQYIRMHLRGR